MKLLAAALVKAQKEMGTASKDSKNPFFKSKYADYNSIREVVLPALNNNDVVVLQPIVFIDNKSFVKTLLMHSSGESIESLTEIVCTKPNDPQASGSAQTYAKRYSLQSFMCVGAEDDDSEAAMGRPSHKIEVPIKFATNDTASPEKQAFKPIAKSTSKGDL